MHDKDSDFKQTELTYRTEMQPSRFISDYTEYFLKLSHLPYVLIVISYVI